MNRSAQNAAAVLRLHRIKVLLAGRDKTYLSLTRLLLTRRGFVVTSASTPSKLLGAVERQRPDVVILDGTGSLSDAARLAAAVEALQPRSRVVVVGDQHQPRLRHLRLLAKWSPLERLVEEIERAYARDLQPPPAGWMG
jgi:PleD family two-component response regulator